LGAWFRGGPLSPGDRGGGTIIVVLFPTREREKEREGQSWKKACRAGRIERSTAEKESKNSDSTWMGQERQH